MTGITQPLFSYTPNDKYIYEVVKMLRDFRISRIYLIRNFCFVKAIIGYVLTVSTTEVSNINSETLMCINPCFKGIWISESDFCV